jgi:hypothetical protein
MTAAPLPLDCIEAYAQFSKPDSTSTIRDCETICPLRASNFTGSRQTSFQSRATAVMSQPGGEGEDRRIYELAALGRDGIHAEIARLRAWRWTPSADADPAEAGDTMARWQREREEYWRVRIWALPAPYR